MSPTTSDSKVFNTGVKRRKPGIIYLSSIPPKMNVTTLRVYFCEYGQIGRVFLQPQEGKKTKKSFSEGWVEFKSKRKAKHVQELLNNEPVGGKRRNASHDVLWNIKYLPRFKWEHLNQRLEYERQIYKKRMGAEISQVNKETDAYLKALMNKKYQKEVCENKEENFKKYFKQKLTEEEYQKRKKLTKKQKDEKFKKSIQKKKKKKQESKKDKTEDDFLASSIFVGNNDED